MATLMRTPTMAISTSRTTRTAMLTATVARRRTEPLPPRRRHWKLLAVHQKRSMLTTTRTTVLQSRENRFASCVLAMP